MAGRPRKRPDASSIKIAVADAYLLCLQIDTGDLAYKAREYVIDLENVTKSITPDMSDDEIADLYISLGLYPLDKYFIS